MRKSRIDDATQGDAMLHDRPVANGWGRSVDQPIGVETGGSMIGDGLLGGMSIGSGTSFGGGSVTGDGPGIGVGGDGSGVNGSGVTCIDISGRSDMRIS